MFKPFYGKCIECKAGTQLIVVRAGLCKYHNELKKAISKSGIIKINEFLSEEETEELKKEFSKTWKGNTIIAKRDNMRIELAKVSSHEKKNIASKKAMYKKFDEIMEGKRYCNNCGKSNALSHSHLVPVSFNKKLEKVISNIVYHCTFKPGFISCHDLWETHDVEIISQMRDYKENMEKIKALDPKYYAILINKTKKQ